MTALALLIFAVGPIRFLVTLLCSRRVYEYVGVRRTSEFINTFPNFQPSSVYFVMSDGECMFLIC